jgi:RNA polymerase sigma-70 factor (ECF subfamily)
MARMMTHDITLPPEQDPATDPRLGIVAVLPQMRAFAMSLSGNPANADDLVQDTIVKAWSNIDKFEPGTNLQAWLFTILRNTFYSGLRRRRAEVPDPDGLHAAKLFELPTHDSRMEFAEFKRAFRTLSPEHREVLVLVGASGLSVQQTAVMLGVAEGTVKSRTNRARRRLAELMALAPAGGQAMGLPQPDGGHGH